MDFTLYKNLFYFIYMYLFWSHQNPLERRQKFVAIRSAVREEEEEDAVPQPSVHYLASQYLAGSSLSADVSQFDFGASVGETKRSHLIIYVSIPDDFIRRLPR